jgi:hypothetical protein
MLALIAGPIAGCSDGTGGTGAGGTGGTDGTGGTGGTGGTPLPDTWQVYYEFFETNPGGEEPRLEGVRSCVTYADTTESCATSNASGRLVLEFRTNEEFTLTVEKEGYGSWIGGAYFGVNRYGASWLPDVLYFGLLPDARLEELAGQLETSYPWQGGIVALVVADSSYTFLEGVTFVPVGSTVDQVGQVFYYDAATQQYNLDLDETMAAADFPLGQVIFTEVTAGVREFEVTGAIGDCYGPHFGLPGDEPNRIRVPVREGFWTWGRMECDPP